MDIQTRLLVQNKHRCCICQQEQVIIHHIDRDRSNNDPKNLAILCLHHHGLAHAKLQLAKNYSEDAIRLYKEDWEGRIREGRDLPAHVTETTAAHLARVYEREQSASRLVLAEELWANYQNALYRYNQCGGKAPKNAVYTHPEFKPLDDGRWKSLGQLGHLQEYVELLAVTYHAISNYNYDLEKAKSVTGAELAQWNLRVGTAICMSLSAVLRSVGREPVDCWKDFGDSRCLKEFPHDNPSS